MYESERTRTEATNYITLTNWLRARLENHEEIDSKELIKLLEALEVSINIKTILANNVIDGQMSIYD